MVLLGQSFLNILGIAHFGHLGFGGLPQLQVCMWHLDGNVRCKDGCVHHGGFHIIHAGQHEDLLVMVLVVAIP